MDWDKAKKAMNEGNAHVIDAIFFTEERSRTPASSAPYASEEERRSMEERLQHAEKMEALGQLVGGVAHDLNNVLGLLSGYSELLLMEIPEGIRSRSQVGKMLKSPYSYFLTNFPKRDSRNLNRS
jgi:signal transduction histidine kinase